MTLRIETVYAVWDLWEERRVSLYFTSVYDAEAEACACQDASDSRSCLVRLADFLTGHRNPRYTVMSDTRLTDDSVEGYD